MRTRQSEARRLIRQHGMDEPAVEQLGNALTRILFVSRHLATRRRRGHGRARRQPASLWCHVGTAVR
jgi:hypothetical protein